MKMVEMGSWAICEQGWRKGPWTPEEDKLLIEYVSQNGEGRWSCVSKSTGLKRNGKSCRLRWVNYLRPGLKKGEMTPQEEGIIIELHALCGNKWSTIAGYLPGRTDNEIKNYWRTHFKKRKPTETKQENKKSLALKRQKIEQEDCNSIEASPQSTETQSSDGKNSNQEAHIIYPSIDDQEFFHMIYQDTTSLWSDFITIDSYLSDELWNLSNQNGCSNVDATNHNQDGGYMF